MGSKIIVRGGFLLAVLWAPVSFASSGGVLLPPVTGSTAPVANLGLGGSMAADAASQQGGQAQTTTGGVAAPLVVPTKTAPSAVSSNAAQTAKPVPAHKAAAVPNMTVSSPVSPSDAARLQAAGQIPTTVMHQPDISSAVEHMNVRLPYSLQISMSDRFVLSAEDARGISSKLGIQNPASACLLSPRGMVTTDKGSFPTVGGASPQAVVHYDGMIQKFMIQATAYCKTSALPANGGILTQVGDYYMISLQPVTCPSPNRQVSTLSITYNGNNASQCVYN